MHRSPIRPSAAVIAMLGLALGACGASGGASDDASGDIPTIVVTTNILADVVDAAIGDAAEVIAIMPVGADPHDFQASAQEVDAMMNADALIVNGESFEEGLLDVIESAAAEGVPTFEALSAVETIEFGEGGHDEHSDDEHSDDEHSDDEHSDDEHSDDEHSDDEHSDDEHSDDEHSDDEHSGDDPHFFTDPARMADAVDGIVDFLQETIDFADPAAVTAASGSYLAALADLDSEVAALVESIPESNRVLVTNHEVFGYFADRYGFEVVGAVIPSGSTTDSASARELAELTDVVQAEGVPAIFSDVSSSDELAQTLAAEVGDIQVVALYTESLGGPDSDGGTYLDMVRTNGQRISAALS